MPRNLGDMHQGSQVAVSDAHVENDRTDLLALSHAIHADPEVGFEEHRASRRVADFLRGRGFDVTIGAFGLDTALVSMVGSGSPRIAFLAEYDALPDIGHACGHNIICASAVGGFAAAARIVADLGGTAMLFGTPAEENGTGKEIMARAGAFDDVDAAIMIHPHAGSDVLSAPTLGLREAKVVFHGQAAHASANPELGRNALDAAVIAYQSISQYRQSLLATDRVHGIISDGGTSPNVIPERAALHYYLRAETPERIRDLTERLHAIFRSAALATGTTAEITWDPLPPCLPVRTNQALAERFGSHFERLGRPVAQQSSSGSNTGSTDLGNVSLRVPAIHPMVGIAEASIGIHTAEFVTYAASPRADAGVIDSAKALAAIAIDLAADPVLLAQVKAEFAASGGAIDVPDLLAVPEISPSRHARFSACTRADSSGRAHRAMRWIR